MDMWILRFGLKFNTIIYFVALVLALTIGSSWRLGPMFFSYVTPSLFCLYGFVCFEGFFTFWHHQTHLVFFLPQPWNQQLLHGSLIPLIRECCLETKIDLLLGVLIATGCHCF